MTVPWRPTPLAGCFIGLPRVFAYNPRALTESPGSRWGTLLLKQPSQAWELRQPRQSEIRGCTFTGPGSAVVGSAGLWAHASGQDLVVSDCTFSEFRNGIHLATSMTDVRVASTRIEKCAYGIMYEAGSIGSDIQISSCVIELDDDDAEAGIYMVDVKRVGITNTHVRSLRNTWPAGFKPYGIVVGPLSGGTDTGRLDLSITGCHIQGFLNQTDNESGNGILIGGGPTSYAVNTTITGNTLIGNNIAVDFAVNTTITGNSVDMGTVGNPGVTYSLMDLRAVSNCTVSGNSVRGMGRATEGIYVSTGGNDTKSDNVTITGNTVMSTFVVGIEVEDWVEDFTVSDNTIDGFIADDTLPCGALVSLSNSNPNFKCPSRGTVTGNNGYRAQNGILVRGSEAEPGTALSVSHNVLNEIGNAANFVVDSFSGSIGIGLEWCTNGSVHGNQLSGVGALSFITLANAYPRPLLAVDCELLTIDSNMISGCVSTGTGATEGISVLTLNDTAGVPRHNFNITNNVVQTADTSGGDTYGIRFFVKRLVGDSLLGVRAVQITDNVVTRVAGTLVEALRVEMGVCGDLFDLTIRDNNLSHYLHVGIHLNAVAGGSTTSQAIDSFRICGNTLHGMDPNVTYTQSQIRVHGETTGVADVRLVDGSITSNKIIGGFDQGITITPTGMDPAKEMTLKNLIVADNEISEMSVSAGGTTSMGVYFKAFGMRSAFPAEGIVNVQISGNTMKNWLHSPILTHGIAWTSVGIPVTMLNIENNVIVASGTDTSPSVVFLWGDATLESSLGDWSYISISGNEIMAEALDAVRDAVVIDLTDTKLENLKVLSNTLQASRSGDDEGQGLELKIDYHSVSGNNINDLLISGNAMEGGIMINSSGYSVKGCNISNNHITCISSAAAHNPIRFDIDGLDEKPTVDNVQIQGNTLIGGATGCSFTPTNSVEHMKDVVFKDNIISDGFYSGFYFDAGASLAVTNVRDLSISGNQISTTPRGIMGSFYTATVAGLTVRNNELRALGEQGIVLLMGGEAAGGDSIANILVDENNIFNVSATSGEPTIEVGMHVPAPGAPGDAKNISVSRNTIAKVGPVDNGATFVFVDMAGWGNTHNIRVCDNNLMGDPDEENAMNTGIYTAVGPTNFNTHVDRNEIQAASRRGIQMASGGDSRVWSVSANNITNISSSALQGIYLNITGSDIVQWRVCDNVVRHVPASAAISTTEGIYLKQGSGSGNWQQGSVCRNNVDQYGFGISLMADNPTAQMREMAVDDNLIGGFVDAAGQTVNAALTNGIRIEATEFFFLLPGVPLVGESILGLSVSRNQINSPSIGTTSSSGCGILLVGGLTGNSEVVRQITISDNKVYQTSTLYNSKSSGIVTYFFAENAMSQIAVERNQIRNISEYGIFTVGRLSSTPSGSCSVWSVSDNQVQTSSWINTSPGNSEPYCNIGVAFPGVGGNPGVTSNAKDVTICRNNSVVGVAGDHYNYYFGVSKDDGVGPSSGWWVCDNSARGGTAANSVVTDYQSGHGVTFAGVAPWTNAGEPSMKTVHDNRCEVTGTNDDWNGGTSWSGAAGDNNHDNDNY